MNIQERHRRSCCEARIMHSMIMFFCALLQSAGGISDGGLNPATDTKSSREDSSSPYSLRRRCATLVAYFLCIGVCITSSPPIEAGVIPHLIYCEKERRLYNSLWQLDTWKPKFNRNYQKFCWKIERIFKPLGCPFKSRPFCMK